MKAIYLFYHIFESHLTMCWINKKYFTHAVYFEVMES